MNPQLEIDPDFLPSPVVLAFRAPHSVPMWQTLIGEWCDYMHAGGLSPQTIRVRRAQLNRAARHLPAPDAVTARDLVAYLANPSWQPETRRSTRAALTRFFAWRELIHDIPNPARVLPAVRVPRSLPRPTPDPVFAAALDAASHRDRLLILFAAHAGARRGEIARLAWTDFHHVPIGGDDVLVLRIVGKGGHVRDVPLSDQLAAELAAERARRNAGRFGSGWRYSLDPASPWLFPGQTGDHISPDRVGVVLSRALSGWNGHTLRHRFATRGYQATHDLRAVQEALGHTSLATTQRYVGVDALQLVELVRAAA